MAEEKAVGVQAQGPAQHAPQAEEQHGGEDERATPPRLAPPVDEQSHGGLAQRDGQGEHDGAASRAPERGAPRDEKGVIDILTLIVTFFVALGTLLLWWATRQLVRSADQNAARQLRAYVGLEDVVVTKRGPQGGAENLSVKIRNFGQVPAQRVAVALAWTDQRRGHSLKPEDVSPDNPDRRTLMPNAVEEIGLLHTTQIVLSSSVVVGRITYDDGFGENRTTNFRLLSRLNSNRFSPASYGNDAD